MWFKWVGIGFDIKLVHLNHIIFSTILSCYRSWFSQYFQIIEIKRLGTTDLGFGKTLNTKALENMIIAKLNILYIGTNSQQPVDTHVMQIADSGKCVWFKCEFKSHMRVKIFQRPILRISMIWKWCYYDQGPRNTEQQGFDVRLLGQLSNSEQKNSQKLTNRPTTNCSDLSGPWFWSIFYGP